MNRQELARSFQPINVADLVKPGEYGGVAVFCCRRCGLQLGQNSETIRYADLDEDRSLVLPDGWSFIDGIELRPATYYFCAACTKEIQKVAFSAGGCNGGED